MKRKHLCGAAALALLIAACGGGSSPTGPSGGDGNPNPPSGPSAAGQAMVKGLVCNGATAATGWCWQNPQPAGDQVTDAYFLDAQQGWVAGMFGFLEKTTDGGATWARLPSAPTHLLRIKFTDTLQGWAQTVSTTEGLRTLDGGLTWQTVPVSDVVQQFATAEQLAAPTATAALPTACVMALDRKDGPQLWAHCTGRYVPLRGGLPSPAAYDPIFILPHVYRSADGGTTWQEVATQFPEVVPYGWALDQVRLAPQGNGVGVLADQGIPDTRRRFVRASVGASQWTEVGLPAALQGAPLTPDAVIDSSTLWLANGSQAQWSEDAGLTWKPLAVAGDSRVPRTVRRDATGALLVGVFDNAGLGTTQTYYRSTDHGQSWRRMPGGISLADANTSVRGIWSADGKKALALASDGGLLDTTDGGQHWQRRSGTPFDRGDNVIGAPYTGRLQGSAAGTLWWLAGGQLMKSPDAGVTVQAAPVPVAMAQLVDLQFVDEQIGFAVTRAGQLFTTTDGGASWAAVPGKPGLQVTQAQFISAKSGLALFYDGSFYESLWRTLDGGATWLPTSFTGRAGTGINRIRFAPEGANVWMVSERSERLFHSADSGQTWTAPAVPTPLALQDIVFAADGRSGWAVGAGGAVIATVDGGASWQLQPNFSAGNTWLYTVFMLDKQTGWVAGSKGSILATATGGR